MSTLNAKSLLVLENDDKFKEALTASYWIVPDGYGAVIACKLLGLKIHQRISGTDIFHEVNYKLNKRKNYKYLFFGSTKKTLGLIANKIKFV